MKRNKDNQKPICPFTCGNRHWQFIKPGLWRCLTIDCTWGSMVPLNAHTLHHDWAFCPICGAPRKLK